MSMVSSAERHGGRESTARRGTKEKSIFLEILSRTKEETREGKGSLGLKETRGKSGQREKCLRNQLARTCLGKRTIVKHRLQGRGSGLKEAAEAEWTRC